MVRIVVGGQIDKKRIADLTRKLLGETAKVDIQGDLEAAMALKSGQYDYYIGACNTGGGGALAIAMALLGPELCATVSMPGRIFPEEQIISAVESGKVAFGFTAEHSEKVLSILLPAICRKRGENI